MLSPLHPPWSLPEAGGGPVHPRPLKGKQAQPSPAELPSQGPSPSCQHWADPDLRPDLGLVLGLMHWLGPTPPVHPLCRGRSVQTPGGLWPQVYSSICLTTDSSHPWLSSGPTRKAGQVVRLTDTYQDVTTWDNTTRGSHQQTLVLPETVHDEMRAEPKWDWWYPDVWGLARSLGPPQGRTCPPEN